MRPRCFSILLLLPSWVLAQTPSAPLTTDVLVVGGGASGTMAAIQAARSGAKVTLVEATPWLGGMLTAAGVSAIDGNHRLSSGLWAEFRQQLIAHYGSAEALSTGWVSNVQFEPAVAARLLRAMAAREPNLTVLTQTRWKNLLHLPRGWQLTATDSTGAPSVIGCRILVDATELGDVAARAGATFDLGMEARAQTGEAIALPRANNVVQDLTYVATLKDYGPGTDHTIPRPRGYDPAPFRCCCRAACPDTTQPKLLDCDKMLTYGKLPNNKYMINWPRHGNDYYANVVEASEATRQAAFARAKNFTLQFVYFLQTELGYRHIGLPDDEYPTADRLPFFPYHRESRRVRGLVRFTMTHVLAPFDQPLYRTGIAVGDYPIDHHHGKQPQVPALDFVPVPSYNLPLGCLVPKRVPRLVVAEKSISVSNLVNGTTRLQPVALLIGQAAGALAAIAARQDVSPADVAVRAVQDTLLNAGAYLMPYVDVPPSHPQFAAVQRVGATGILRGTGIPKNWANETRFYPDSTLTERTLAAGLRSYEPTLALSAVTDRALTRAKAAAMVDALARHLGKPAPESLPIAPDQPVTRAELAAWLDARVDPFHRKAVNWQGAFLPMKAKASK